MNHVFSIEFILTEIPFLFKSSFRFPVEERVLRRATDRDGHDTLAIAKHPQPLGGQAGTKHDPCVHTHVSRHGASGTDRDTQIDRVDRAGHQRRLLAAGRETAMAAIQGLHLLARPDDHHRSGASQVLRVAQEELEARLPIDMLHLGRQALDVLSRDKADLDHVNPLPFRRGPGGHHHPSRGLEHQLLPQISLTLYHINFFSSI